MLIIEPLQIFLCIITRENESSFLSGKRTIRTFWECGRNQHQMKHICVVYRKIGTPVDTSCDVAIVFPNFLWQQTSHIQQASPTSGDLNSFVLPIHKWMPLLLHNEVMPQGQILTRLTGSNFLIQFTFFYSASSQMDVYLNRILGVYQAAFACSGRRISARNRVLL